MSDIRSIYAKLKQHPDVELPSIETFVSKYNSKEGLGDLHNKLSGLSDVELPSKNDFINKYYSTPVVKPTTTATSKVSTAPTTTTTVSGDTTRIVSKNEPITIDITPPTTAPTSVVNPMDVFKKFFGEGIYGAGTVG